jgi:hypothetical protein
MTRHLIHIGYPKTGSNFLRAWFAAHPALAFAPEGIAGFTGATDMARQAALGAESPLFRVTSAEALATPHPGVGAERIDYAAARENSIVAAQAVACAMLAATFPEAHVLIVTRGFKGMILSSYSQFVRTGGDLDFDDFGRPPGETGADEGLVWDYDRLIGLYRAAFAGRVHVVPYELLRDDPAAFVRAIEQRLGLPHHGTPTKRHNPSLSGVEMAWYPRLTRLVRALPVGARLLRRIEKAYLRMAMANRFGRLIALCQRIRPRTPVSERLVSDAVIGKYRGRATLLGGDPLYAPYLDDYLLCQSPAATY